MTKKPPLNTDMVICQIREKYVDINEAVTSAGIMAPVVFDEYKHLDKPFESNLERFRYFQDLQLKCPVDIIRFSPGGSSVSTVCIVQVSNQNRSNAEMLTQGARLLQTVRPNLKEYHTRAQRRLFKEKLKKCCFCITICCKSHLSRAGIGFFCSRTPCNPRET